MSVDQQSPIITAQAPYTVCLAQTLSESDQHNIKSLLNLLPTDLLDTGSFDNNLIQNRRFNSDDRQETSAINIANIVDGRGLACPMPLLKTKIALRNIAINQSLYVIATDPNSQADIIAFCQQTQKVDMAETLSLVVNQRTDGLVIDNASAQTFDTIFHFIITKTDSN